MVIAKSRPGSAGNAVLDHRLTTPLTIPPVTPIQRLIGALGAVAIQLLAIRTFALPCAPDVRLKWATRRGGARPATIDLHLEDMPGRRSQIDHLQHHPAPQAEWFPLPLLATW